MPLTTLDNNVALVVIDLQKGVVGMPTAHPAGEIVSRAAQLASAFREKGLPVVLVNVTGVAPGRTDSPRPNLSQFPSDWTELTPELNHQPTDIIISKPRWGAFVGTALHAELQKRSVTQIVLAGVATTIGVESTARSAYDHGYTVALAVDAMTDRDAGAHRHSVEKIFPRLGELDTTENILKLLSIHAPAKT